MKQKRVKGELFALSTSAKQRMKMGYWTEIKRAREMDKQSASIQGKNPESVTDYYRNKFVREFSLTKNNINRDEEALYNKICTILEKDEDVINPIGQLVDQDYYKDLDSNAKQRYILTLASKYRELKERYQKEKSLRI